MYMVDGVWMGTCCMNILNSLSMVYLGNVNLQEKSVAEVKFGVNNRCSDCTCSKFRKDRLCDQISYGFEAFDYKKVLLCCFSSVSLEAIQVTLKRKFSLGIKTENFL